MTHHFTVDVEEYFHVTALEGAAPRGSWGAFRSRVDPSVARLLDLLAQHEARATFFVLGWLAARRPGLVKTIAAAGHEIGSHGWDHALVTRQTPDAFRRSVRRTKAVLEALTGKPVLGFRAPSFSIVPGREWALDVLIEEGYAYDSSIFPIRHDRYGIPVSARHPYTIERPGGRVTEVPGSTVRVGPLNFPVAGGGYFRILPYRWTRWGIARLNRVERRSAVFYLHPWEIDPDQPRLTAGWLGRFRHYRNLHDTENRLRVLLRDFRFGSVQSLLAQETAAGALGAPALPYLW